MGNLIGYDSDAIDWFDRGVQYFTSGKYSEAIECYKNSLSMYPDGGNQERIARCYYTLGECYRMLDKYSEAVTNYEQSLSIYQEIGDQDMIARCYYGLGECYQKLNKYSEAVTNYEQSLNIYQEIGDQDMIARCYYGLGRCYRMLDKYSEAVINYGQSLSIFQDRGNQDMIAHCYYDLGDCYQMLNKYSEAVTNYEQSLSIYQERGDQEMIVRCYYGLGGCYRMLDKYYEAVINYEQSLSIYQDTGDQAMIARCYYGLGVCYRMLDKYSEAVTSYAQSLSIYQERGDQEMIAQCYYDLGECYKQSHDYDIIYAKKGAEIAKETGDLKTEGNAYVCIGDALYHKGNVREAMEYDMKGLEIATQTGDKQSEAKAHNNLGVASVKLGKHYDAIRYFETSIKLNSELGSENNTACLYSNIGVLYKTVGQYHKAAKFVKQSLDIVKETGKISTEISAYQNLSAVYFQTNDFTLARECRWKSTILAIQTGNKRGEVKYFNDLGKCFRKTDKITEAITSHKKALHLALKFKLYNLIGYCYKNLGYTYFQFGMVDEAIHVSEKGLTIYTDSGDKEKEAGCRYDIGMMCYYGLARKQNVDHVQYARNIKTSEQYTRESLQCYEELFDDLREKHEFKISIVDTYVKGYSSLALLLINTNRTTEALIVCERGRACALGDTLVCKYGMQQQQVFVENMSTRKPLNEHDLIDLVPKESSLLFYSTIHDSEHLWVLSQQRSLIYAHNNIQQNSVTTKNITDYIYQLADSAYQSMDVRKMTANCEDRSLGKQEPCYSEGDDNQSQLSNSIARMTIEQDIIDHEYSSSSRNPTASTSIGSDQHNDTKEPLKELFKQLITPVEEHLTQDEVIIIPDGPLNLVPFAALQDPQTGRSLCETKRIRLAPSLTTLKILNACPDDYHSKQGALVIGNPCVGEVMFRGEKKTFLNLRGAETEAENIEQLLNVTPLIGKAATKDAVKEKLKEDAAVIHIAAHGDDATGEIALAPGISAQSKAIPEEEDYILSMQEVQEIGVRAKLVVLSCCHSGRGEIRAVGVVCMARAFLAAGARAVVASLWNTNDSATLQFMRQFYLQLKRGESASVSLNKSMKKMIEGKRYNRPKYWAPFFLIGDDVTIY